VEGDLRGTVRSRFPQNATPGEVFKDRSSCR
jgi:hypothetical protein